MIKVPGVSPGLAWIYGQAVTRRNKGFDSGRSAIRKLPRPVISIGNLTVGGTGKTPFTIELARLLSGEGYLCCILSRGHGGFSDGRPRVVSDLLRIREPATVAGDEPYLMARKLPGVPVVVGHDRHAAGLHALSQFAVQVFLLDDGFQHRSLARDVDMVLIDAKDPWGGGMMPAGRLREPPEALARASLIVLTRLHAVDAEGLGRLKADLVRLAPNTPVLATRMGVPGLRHVPGLKTEPLSELKGRRVFAFAGLAHPEHFFADCGTAGLTLVGRHAFPDHHAYTSADLKGLLHEAEARGADTLLTTEKDSVRLPAPPADGMPVRALRMRLLPEDPAGLVDFVYRRLPAAK